MLNETFGLKSRKIRENSITKSLSIRSSYYYFTVIGTGGATVIFVRPCPCFNFSLVRGALALNTRETKDLLRVGGREGGLWTLVETIFQAELKGVRRTWL